MEIGSTRIQTKKSNDKFTIDYVNNLSLSATSRRSTIKTREYESTISIFPSCDSNNSNSILSIFKFRFLVSLTMKIVQLLHLQHLQIQLSSLCTSYLIRSLPVFSLVHDGGGRSRSFGGILLGGMPLFLYSHFSYSLCDQGTKYMNQSFF